MVISLESCLSQLFSIWSTLLAFWKSALVIGLRSGSGEVSLDCWIQKYENKGKSLEMMRVNKWRDEAVEDTNGR